MTLPRFTLFIVRDAPHTPGRRTASKITQSLRDTKPELYLIEATNSACFLKDEITYYSQRGKLVTFRCSHHHFWQTTETGTGRTGAGTYPPRPPGGKGAFSRGSASTKEQRRPHSPGHRYPLFIPAGHTAPAVLNLGSSI